MSRRDDIGNAVEASKSEGDQAFLVAWQTFSQVHNAEIVRAVNARGLPSVYELRESVEAGGLMAYGVNRVAVQERQAAYVDKILRGGKPGDLPIEQPTAFELVINAKTAAALGLTVPPNLLAQADDVIE